jgi:rsbT antagonist protein RsbS
MEFDGESTRVPIQSSHGCLVASIQVDLDDAILARFQRELLERLHRDGNQGVILDLSGVELLDVEDFEALRRCIAMVSMMGGRSVLVGLQPGVVSALVDLDVDTEGIEATLDLEEAFQMLQPASQPEPPEAAEESSEAGAGPEMSSPRVDS